MGGSYIFFSYKADAQGLRVVLHIVIILINYFSESGCLGSFVIGSR